MPIEVRKVVIKILVCDKCSHRWISRKKDKDGNVILPEKCPRCKSKKWNYKGLNNQPLTIEEDFGVIKQTFGINIAEMIKCDQDKKLHKKKILEEIEKLDRENERRKEEIKMNEELIKSGNTYRAWLEKELKSISE